MASKNTEKSIIKLALEYYIDGNSLASAMQKAEQKYAESHKRTARLTKQEQAKLFKELKDQSKAADVQVNRSRVEEHLKASRKIQAKEKADRKKRIEQEAAIDKQISDKRKNSFLGGFDNFGKKLGTISSYGGAITIINAVREAAQFLIKKSIELESAFNDLAVKSGYTNREMASVSKTVLDVAQSTKFSTLEIVGAATALGKLGFEAEEVKQILPSLANVAGATGESLQATAEILGKVINAYGFSADQAGVISDRLVDTFNNSALNLERFNTAFSYVGSAAASTGTSFNELTSAMAILSDRGITASKIGTGLRNVFTKLGTEGDSLRDILQRISDAHLSFYEVAELVGRRAANQLFIMADSLDEFDANVARSLDDYGSAARAAAQQMDTFQAKLDIMINTFTNWVAPEFDPNDVWKNSINESINLMDLFNILLSEDNVTPFLKRIVTQYPELSKEFKATREELGSMASDYDVLTKMIKDNSETLKNAKAGGFTGEGGIQGIQDYVNALTKIQTTLDTDSGLLSSAILGEDEAREKSKVQKRVIKYKDILQNTISKISKELGTDDRNAFIDAYVQGNDKEVADAILLRLRNIKKLTDKDYLNLKQQRGAGGIFGDVETELKDQFKSYDREDTMDVLARQWTAERDTIRTINNEKDAIHNLTNINDKANIEKRIENREKLAKEICEIDPVYAAQVLGIECPTKKTGRRDRGEIGKIDRFAELREKYKTDKDLLSKQYSAEDDPIQKMVINNKMVDLEKTFRSQMNDIYNDYLAEQSAMRDEFCRKYPDQCAQFDANIVSTEDSQIKDKYEGERNLQTYSNRDVDAKAKAFENEFNKAKEFQLKISALDLEYRSKETDTTKKKQDILDRRNKIVDDYYDDAISNAEIFYTDMVNLANDIEAQNQINLDEGGSVVDTEKLLEQIAKYQGIIDKLNAERNAAKKTINDKDDNSNFDYFAAAMEMSNNLYNVYKEAADRRLELLKEQTERELQVVQDRFDREAEIRNSALEGGIISQEQAIEAEERARKKKIDNENKINKKLFEAQKKRDKEDAIFNGLTATAQAIANAFAKNLPPVAVVMASISAAAIAASTAMNIKAISGRKFVPQQYADGGLIEGKSHAEGGVPFTVRGQAGFEAEGGEFIVNKEATAKHLDELKRINSRTQKGNRKFADGGIISAEQGDTLINQAILEALSKPVRAYVSTQDLATSQSEREALTKKITY